MLHESFETDVQDRFWPFSVCCFKSYSGVLAFEIFTAVTTAPKKQRLCRLFNFYQNWLQIDILSEKNELGLYA